MGDKNNKIFVITGEQSGDLNAANLINKICKLNDKLIIKGIGGKYLKSADTELLYDYKELNFVGFSEVIKNYFKIKKIFNSCLDYIKSFNPAVILLVDFPGFNLKFAEKVKKFYDGKIIYYISPQIWAWHKRRIKLIKNYVDDMLVIYPFEVEFYQKEGLRVFYSGNPLLENIDNFLRTACKIKNEKPVITLMPGSRDEEFGRIFPEMAKSVPQLRKKFDAEINLLLSENISVKSYEYLIGKLGIRIIKPENDSDKYRLIHKSELVITKFGTSSTECAFLGTPFIVVYKADKLNYLIAKNLIKVKYAAMINIIAGKEVVKEFIQDNFTADNILFESEKIIEDTEYRNSMINEFGKMKEIFYNTKIIKSPENIINDNLS